jgi:hypothetical protein
LTARFGVLLSIASRGRRLQLLRLLPFFCSRRSNLKYLAFLSDALGPQGGIRRGGLRNHHCSKGSQSDKRTRPSCSFHSRASRRGECFRFGREAAVFGAATSYPQVGMMVITVMLRSYHTLLSESVRGCRGTMLPQERPPQALACPGAICGAGHYRPWPPVPSRKSHPAIMPPAGPAGMIPKRRELLGRSRSRRLSHQEKIPLVIDNAVVLQ